MDGLQQMCSSLGQSQPETTLEPDGPPMAVGFKHTEDHKYFGLVSTAQPCTAMGAFCKAHL